MDIGLLHSMCKKDTRKAFENFKSDINIELFPINEKFKNDIQKQMVQGLFAKTVKHFVMTYNLTETQIQILKNVTDQYKDIILKTSNNYLKRFFK